MAKESARYIVLTDIMFRSPLWALLVLALWGGIAWGMLWLLLNVVKPSVDRRIETRAEQAVMNDVL